MDVTAGGCANDETGDDEEHVDAGKPTRQPPVTQMVNDHRDHRDGPQAFDMPKTSRSMTHIVPSSMTLKTHNDRKAPGRRISAHA
ncbi:hypothetical protein P3W23_10715 [Luteibacter sp. PPL554]